MAIAFGPIVSRRFGRSLGVNTLPAKRCSYSCVYCQLGPTRRVTADRETFFSPKEVFDAVAQRVNECRDRGQSIDFITFAPDGEPTLDGGLGAQLLAIRALGIPVAVITNGSLLWREDVRRELEGADIVSVEVDAVDVHTWLRMDRAHSSLQLPAILDGIRAFARESRKRLWTQTMLVAGINDDESSVAAIAGFLAELCAARVCLSVPTRPPGDTRFVAPDEATMSRAFAVLRANIPYAEAMFSNASDSFVATADAVNDLLSALAVHPMQEEAVTRVIGRQRIDELVQSGQLVRSDYGNARYLSRR